MGKRETEVLVVGAGPVGLVAACELSRRRVDVRVVDALDEPNQLSKAVGVHARSLEHLERLGVVERFLDEGRQVHGFEIVRGGEVLVSMRLDGIDSRYPYVLCLPQPTTESLLAARLVDFGGEVERGLRLVALTQDTDGVDATLVAGDGSEEHVRARWVVGCDGSHSVVRDLVGTKLEGSFHGVPFLLTDTEADWDEDWEVMRSWFHPDGITAAFPLKGNRLRLVAQVPEMPDGEPTLAEAQALVDERVGGGLRLRDPHWLTYLEIHHGQVPRYRSGRVFLAGDAAHIHSPVGGQGMNTGMQDAWNLAWKLHLVCREDADPGLLDSYQDERHAVGAAVVSLTSRATSFGTVRNLALQELRDLVIGVIGRRTGLRERMAERVAELAVRYRRSPIVGEQVHGDHHHDRIRAGERLPDIEGLADLAGHTTRLWQRLPELAHPVLVVAGPRLQADADLCRRLAGQLREEVGDLGPVVLVVRVAPGDLLGFDDVLVDGAGLVSESLGLDEDGLVVVRPDGYVGYVSVPPHADAVGRYAELIGLA